MKADPAGVLSGTHYLDGDFACGEGALAAGCRFGDCSHVHEPQCAVRHAVESESLSAARYASYLRILGLDPPD